REWLLQQGGQKHRRPNDVATGGERRGQKKFYVLRLVENALHWCWPRKERHPGMGQSSWPVAAFHSTLALLRRLRLLYSRGGSAASTVWAQGIEILSLCDF